MSRPKRRQKFSDPKVQGALARRIIFHWLMFVARRNGQPIGASLVAIDRQRGEAGHDDYGADFLARISGHR